MVKWLGVDETALNKKQVIFLDTETTGLNPPRDKIVELAIIDSTGNMLLNTLVNPMMNIPETVINIHGIHDGMVQESPVIEDLLPSIRKILDGTGQVVIYNADFDTRFFPEEIWENVKISCCMKEFIFVYEELEGHFSSQRFPLSKAFNVSTGRKIEELGQPHRALTDCLACAGVWNWCLRKRKIIDDPNWKNLGYEVFCDHCRKQTFHKFRPRYREGFNRYYQCLECLQNNISETQMESILQEINEG
jgi:DNA polymerase III epsilon subunit-like protein